MAIDQLNAENKLKTRLSKTQKRSAKTEMNFNAECDGWETVNELAKVENVLCENYMNMARLASELKILN